jgi:CheY-like chemotaxis protein
MLQDAKGERFAAFLVARALATVTQSHSDFLMSIALIILVADDNEDDAFLLQEAFKKAGVANRLLVVGDGLEAVAYLKGDGVYSDRAAHPYPDVLLLDLNMPRMNGFEVLEWLRKDSQCRRLVVHVLTASCRDEDVRRAYDLHANSYVMKPTRVDELVAFAATLHQWHRFTCLPPPPGNGKAP